MMTATFPKPVAGVFAEALARAGFTPAPDDTYERGDLRLTLGAHWCVLVAPSTELPIPAGYQGLWKRVGSPMEVCRIFALPRRIWDVASATETLFDGEITVIEQCLQWAVDTSGHSVPSGWQSPPRTEVESWFQPEQLTVVAGSLLRQGELICEPDRLAIRFPLVPELPPDLPESRRAWLRVLLDEAQDRWHLVRLEVPADDDGQSGLVAEVDLSGVPHAIAEDLFVISLEALRWVVQWLGETTDWLADACVVSELLAVCPNNQPQESP